MGEDVRTVERPTVGAEGETAPTVGGVVSWLVFGWVTATIGWMALPQAGRLYDFRAFYAAGDMVRHQPGRLYDLAAQAAVQNAVVCPMWRGVPFYHPSYEALLYVPLTWMHYHTAYMVYVVWNLLLLGAAYMLAPRTVDAAVAKAPRAALFFLCFP
ncbi:MAG TPA: hypothetical protein VFE06_05520, partial [Acidobacteriaceae bacterium]|nr:hypothetical protein [Acidobacteriaceae bacterium]